MEKLEICGSKIVIIQEFASSHFLKLWLENVAEVLQPNAIIINSGLFINGPENKGNITEAFKKKYCYLDRNVGFDWEEIQQIVNKFESAYPSIYISLNEIIFDSDDVNECFIKSMTSFGNYDLKPKTLIFPLEPDAFLFEGDKKIINEEISKLKPGEGIQCKWMDFLETQYYTEAINLQNPKFRRFCYCFDTLENYKKAIDGFMSQNYPLLRKTESFFIRHYPWFVFDKWKELRYELIYRSDPQYWKDFENGLFIIRTHSNAIAAYDNLAKMAGKYLYDNIMKKTAPDKIIIRPSRQDEGRFAQFIDIDHPKHIQSHPNFVK